MIKPSINITRFVNPTITEFVDFIQHTKTLTYKMKISDDGSKVIFFNTKLGKWISCHYNSVTSLNESDLPHLSKLLTSNLNNG